MTNTKILTAAAIETLIERIFANAKGLSVEDPEGYVLADYVEVCIEELSVEPTLLQSLEHDIKCTEINFQNCADEEERTQLGAFLEGLRDSYKKVKEFLQ